MLVESSGIHANGLSLARKIAGNIAREEETSLPQAYAAPLSDGTMYGEALLTPTHIYAGLVRDLFANGVDIHYMANITGHGWRKIMRNEKELTYRINRIPKPQPVFRFIQHHSHNPNTEMYGNFNMGGGFAIFVPAGMEEQVEEIAFRQHGLEVLNAGKAEEGPRQVIIEPVGLTYKADTLGVR